MQRQILKDGLQCCKISFLSTPPLKDLVGKSEQNSGPREMSQLIARTYPLPKRNSREILNMAVCPEEQSSAETSLPKKKGGNLWEHWNSTVGPEDLCFSGTLPLCTLPLKNSMKHLEIADPEEACLGGSSSLLIPPSPNIYERSGEESRPCGAVLQQDISPSHTSPHPQTRRRQSVGPEKLLRDVAPFHPTPPRLFPDKISI